MTELDVIDIGKDALWTLLKVSAPIMLVSMVVGLCIALFQALTQIQEMTLTFVPKIVAVFLTIMATMPFIFTTLRDFNEELHMRIIGLEQEDGTEDGEK